METNPGFNFLNTLLYKMPAAFANIKGNSQFPDLYGVVRFYPVVGGVIVNPELYGLPVENSICSNHIFGFHIHEGSSCTGTTDNPFSDAGTHYNPGGCVHPAHAGDLQPLFATHNGFAWGAFLMDRFKWGDILGRTIIVHSQPDDFRTQPSGDSGDMIGCGVIERA